MLVEERRRKIEAYGQAYAYLVTALNQFPQEMWQFKPTPSDWSVHELVVHIADSEANSYSRCRKAIVEPGAMVMAYDEALWARTLHYHDQDPLAALELFKWLRGQTYQLIRDLPESVWAHTIEHPENGIMTLDDWLDVYERHIPEHVAQMELNLAAWRNEA